LLQEIQISFGFTILVLAQLGSPVQNPESRKMIVVIVIASAAAFVAIIIVVTYLLFSYSCKIFNVVVMHL